MACGKAIYWWRNTRELAQCDSHISNSHQVPVCSNIFHKWKMLMTFNKVVIYFRWVIYFMAHIWLYFMAHIWLYFMMVFRCLTNFCPLTPIGDMYLSRCWLRKFPAAWRHKVIICAAIGFSLNGKWEQTSTKLWKNSFFIETKYISILFCKNSWYVSHSIRKCIQPLQ